jgi:hypothetical protein
MILRHPREGRTVNVQNYRLKSGINKNVIDREGGK